MRANFKQIQAWAKGLGVNVEQANKPRCKYEVWTDGSVIDECSTLAEVIESVEDMTHHRHEYKEPAIA